MNDQTQLIRIVIDARPAKEGGEDAKRALKGIEDQTSRMGTSLQRMEDKLGAALGKLKGIAVAAAIAWGSTVAGQALNAASGLEELADQLQITTRFLQASQLSAIQNGAKLEQLEVAYGKFSQKMGEAADGNKGVIETLEQLGVKNLDLQGKLRPTQDLMEDVARAILAIEDPAKRSAAAVDFFGKSGMRLLPMFKDLAAGAKIMENNARLAGAMIDDETIKKLDTAADRMASFGLKARAFAAREMASAMDELDQFDAWLQKQADSLNQWGKNLGNSGFVEAIRNGLDELVIAGGQFIVTFTSYFAQLPSELPKFFIDALNGAIAAVEGGLNIIGNKIATEFPWLSGKLGINGSAVSFGRIEGGGAASFDERVARAGQAGETWAANKRQEFANEYARQRAAKGEAALQAAADAASYFYATDGAFAAPTPGAGLSKVKGAGSTEAKKIDKLQTDAEMALAYEQKMAEAAKSGAAAVEELELRYKTAKAAQDAYGDSAKANAPAVEALAKKLYDLATAADKAKNLKEFRLGTAGIESENELLAAEVRLANELPEIRARELAILKVMQEVKKRGVEDAQEDIDARIRAVEQQELLKTKIEETKKATELWTEPFKSALQSIQTTAADLFDKMLETGKFSFEELGQIGTRIIRRMVAEMMALAVIRPMLGNVVTAMSGLGIIPAGIGQQLGYSSSVGSIPGLGTGGGFSMPSIGGGFMGSMTGSLGSFGQWLNTPFTGPYAGISPGAMAGVPQITPSIMNPSTWSITPLQGIGAVAGIGSGIFQLASGKGSTGSTIGGISSIAGGIMSMIPGLQPFGMALSFLGPMLGGLFGGGQQSYVDNQAYGQLSYGSGGWSTSGGAWGPDADARSLQQPLGQVGQSIDSIFSMLGGVKDPSKVWGLASETSSRTGGGWNLNQSWSYLIDPTTGAKSLWRAGEDNMMDSGGAQVAIRSILAGAVGEITQSMRTALYTVGQRGSSGTIGQVGEAVNFVTNIYDKLGKSVGSVAEAIKKLNAEFDATAATAANLGLSLAPVREEQEKQTKRLAQDFVDSMLDPLALELRKLDDQRKDSIASAEYIRDNVKGVYVDMARITEYWLKKEADLKEQFYGASVTSLEDAIKRLTPGGNLANLDPAGTMAGLNASYAATYAQAQAGDQEAIARLAGEGVARAEFAKTHFAGSPAYNAIRDEIVANMQSVLAAVQIPAANGGAPLDVNNPGISTLVQQTQQLQATVQLLLESDARKSDEITRLLNLLSRYVTNRAA